MRVLAFMRFCVFAKIKMLYFTTLCTQYYYSYIQQ
jgi:hypothetical protein